MNKKVEQSMRKTSSVDFNDVINKSLHWMIIGIDKDDIPESDKNSYNMKIHASKSSMISVMIADLMVNHPEIRAEVMDKVMGHILNEKIDELNDTLDELKKIDDPKNQN